MRTLTLQETKIVSGGLLGIQGIAGIAVCGLGSKIIGAGIALAPFTLGSSAIVGAVLGGIMKFMGTASIAASILLPII